MDEATNTNGEPLESVLYRSADADARTFQNGRYVNVAKRDDGNPGPSAHFTLQATNPYALLNLMHFADVLNWCGYNRVDPLHFWEEGRYEVFE